MRSPVSYTIDSSDVIVEVHHAWFDFAHGNDAADLVAAAVGRPLWSFIAGATVRGVYKDLLQRVREGQWSAFRSGATHRPFAGR